jgi:hypothetical protein
VTPAVVVAEFTDVWEARLARDTLAHAGVEAWLEPVGSPGEGRRRLLLLVAPETEAEARALLDDMRDEDVVPTPRRPVWVPVVAAVVVVGLVWAAVPRFLWPWILLTAFVGFLLWSVASPRRPES